MSVLKKNISNNRLIYEDALIVKADLDSSEDFDINVKITSNDTTTGYLSDKLTAGNGIDFTTNNPSGNENIEISIDKNEFPGVGHWEYELQTSVSLRAIDTAFDADSDYLDITSGNGIYNIEYREDTGLSNGSLGALRSIGSNSAMTAADWASIDGVLFEYVCQDKNYINIVNNTADSIGSNRKKILTRAGSAATTADLQMIQRALFTYNHDAEAWIVLAYTKARWLFRYSILGTETPGADSLIVNLPNNGYYNVYYSIFFEQLDSGVSVNSATAETISFKTTSETITAASKSAFVPDVTSSAKLVNNNLTGALTIRCNAANCAARTLKFNLTLPNGTTQTIDSGYIHVNYNAKYDGSSCL